MLGPADLQELCAHFRRGAAESGRDGDVIFRPRSADEPFEEAATVARHRGAWKRRLDEPHWVRTWGLVIDGVIHGHVDLQGGELPAELHRATLGIGIERAARSRGFGREMMSITIAWGREHGLAWIDLGVFALNKPARALYLSLGFVEVGTTRDRFRVDGQQIDDVAMTLAL